MTVRRLPLDDLMPGMRVAEPVTNSQSVLLLKAGTELSLQSIRTLKTWGVTHVRVEGSREDADPADAAGRSEAAREVETALARKFASLGEDPVMAEIRRVAASLILKRLP